MLMSKDDFKKAFREAVSSEFSQIPCDEDSIDFTFSERFNKKMRKLIKSQRKSYYFLINTAAKRVAVVFVAILTLFTASMSIKAIREPVVKFITEVYESFTRYFFDGDTVQEIKKPYKITDLPDGYTQTNIYENAVSITTIYENIDSGKIELTQGISGNTDFYIDNENCEQITFNIGDIKVDLYEWQDLKEVIWVKDVYVFDMTLESTNLEISDIEKIILSIE